MRAWRTVLRSTTLLLLAGAATMAPAALEAQPGRITVSGIVRDAGSGDPIVGVSVIHNSLVVAATNAAGMYEARELALDSVGFTLLYKRIGYATGAQDVAVPDTGSVVRVDVTLLPSPTEVERIVVSGERVAVANPGLVGFYERREQGFGTYLTGEEIARIGGTDLQPHLRRLRLHYGLDRSVNPFAGGLPTFPDSCFIAYLDGIRLMDLTAINEWIPASSLGGIELHRPEEFSHLPGEFVPPLHAGCETSFRVVMFWSKVQQEPSPFEFGMHLGAQVGGEENSFAQYVGAQFITRVRSGASTLRLHVDVDARVGGDGSKWMALLYLTARPFGRRSPLYAGLGGGLSKRSTIADAGSGESLAAHHTVLSGLSFDVAFVRPFVEVLVLDPLQPSRIAVFSQAGARIVLGS